MFASHAQYISSKQPVLIYLKTPPTHPRDPPPPTASPNEKSKWKTAMDAFAKYWLLAMHPEPECYDGSKTPYSYDYTALCDWIE